MTSSDLLEYKSWDSTFFNQDIYDVNVQCFPDLNEEILSKVKKGLIQTKVPSDCVDAMDVLQQLGFVFVETDVCFEYDCSEKRVNARDLSKVQLAESADIPQIEELAFNSFAFSRFRSPWFKKTDSSRLYAEWARKAVLKQYDDVCLKIENTIDQNILGIVTAKQINPTEARIGLICTTEQHRGKNIGSELLESIENWCSSRGIKKIYVSTQGSNIRACSFYLRHNYQLNAISYWLYKSVL